MKRGTVTGFDGINGKETAKRIKNWKKNQPAGKWRAVKQVRIKYTYILQTWSYDEKTFTQKFICPLGMVKYMSNLLEDKKLYHRFNVLPNAIKAAFSLTSADDYNNENLSINCEDEGDKGYDNFYILFCSSCKRDKYPDFIKRFQHLLPENPKIEDIQEHWDEFIAVDATVAHEHDFCGCILPNNPTIIADPNNRRFILRPVEHSDKYHLSKETTESSRKHPAESSSSSDDVVVKKTCTNTLLGKGGQLTTIENCSQIGTTKDGDKVKITDKSGKIKFTQKNIASMLDPKISIFESPKNSADQWSQNYALSTILSGANKNLSQAATVHLYETAMEGVRGYHKTVLGDIELNGKKIPPPPRVTLNENNISDFQSGLLRAYKQLNRSDSPYNSLRSSFSKYYSVFNDSIQKFSMELNGVMIRTLNDDLKITNVPWALTEIDGGSMDANKLCCQVLSMISSLNKFKSASSNASECFLRDYSERNPTIPTLNF